MTIVSPSPPPQTGHKAPTAAPSHKSGLHRAVYTGDRPSGHPNYPARVSVYNRSARASTAGGRLSEVGSVASGQHSAASARHSAASARVSQPGAGGRPAVGPVAANGRSLISMQFSNYLTMTHTEARRLQSVTRDEEAARSSQTTLGSVRLALLRQQVWSILSEPDSSALAAAVAYFVLGLIFVSTVTFCLETVPYFQHGASRDVFLVVEKLAIAVFTAEYGLRLASTPRKREFLKAREGARPSRHFSAHTPACPTPIRCSKCHRRLRPASRDAPLTPPHAPSLAQSVMNMIDLLSVLPFYIELAMQSGKGGQTRFLRVIRLVRVLRVLKLGSRFQKFQIVHVAIAESRDMMVLLAFLLVLSLIVFSTLMFFAERGTFFPAQGIYSRGSYDQACSTVVSAAGAPETVCVQVPSPFSSIPDTFWWCIVTLMTVGYGDVVPVTPIGKAVAALTMIQAVLLLSLPISVIGTEFTQQWLEYRSMNAAVERGRLAPRFVALRKNLHQHNNILDELLIRVRDEIFDMEDLSMRLADKVKQKKHELAALLHAHRNRSGAGLSAADREEEEEDQRKLQDSAEIRFLEAELRVRERELKEILSHVQTLLECASPQQRVVMRGDVPLQQPAAQPLSARVRMIDSRLTRPMDPPGSSPQRRHRAVDGALPAELLRPAEALDRHGDPRGAHPLQSE